MAIIHTTASLGAPVPGDRLRFANPTVPNVKAQFSSVHKSHPDYLAAWDNGHIPEPVYTSSIRNEFGRDNHLQGIQRLRGDYLAVTGGSERSKEKGSHIFVCRLESRHGTGPWGSNIRNSLHPEERDGVRCVIRIDRKLWHAGGFCMLGDVLAVPLEVFEPKRDSRIVFYGMKDPENPTVFDHAIERPGKKAVGIAMVRLPSKFFLAAVVYDAGDLIDFYRSKSTSFFDGFHETPVSWPTRHIRAVSGQKANFGAFQNINFVEQSDGKLFLVGFHNTASAAPLQPGRDFADLYEVRFPTSVFAPIPTLKAPLSIKKVANRHISCPDSYCNFDAGGGCYVHPNGALTMYGVTHWLSDGLLRFAEFRERRGITAPSITKRSDSWIDLYEHTRFAGRRLGIVGGRGATIPDYGRILVQGSSFDRIVSSIRHQLPAGTTYRLFEDRGFGGKSFDLKGTGGVVEIRNMKKEKFNDDVRSSRFV